MLELSVAQTISEVEERLYLQFLGVPVTYKRTFAVHEDAVLLPERQECRAAFNILWEGNREPARWIDISETDAGYGIPGFLTSIPRVNENISGGRVETVEGQHSF